MVDYNSKTKNQSTFVSMFNFYLQKLENKKLLSEGRFIIAAKSYNKPIIGHLAKWMGAIPVERPQDLAKNG